MTTPRTTITICETTNSSEGANGLWWSVPDGDGFEVDGLGVPLDVALDMAATVDPDAVVERVSTLDPEELATITTSNVRDIIAAFLAAS